jgi:hypothetical protein
MTKDNVERRNIIRNELLDLAVPRNEAVRVAKKYLKHSDPYIRCTAGELLYILGDRTGAAALIEIVSSPKSIEMSRGEGDLRVRAAAVLAKYREYDAKDAIVKLYRESGRYEVRQFATELRAREITPDLAAEMKKRVMQNHLVESAMLDAVELMPIAEKKFSDQNAPLGMRVHAAVAMVMFGEAEPYLSFLREVIRSKIVPSKHAAYDVDWTAQAAIQGLGAVKSADNMQTLEAVIRSDHTVLKNMALVQLRALYPQSNEAREVLREALLGRGRVDATTLYKLVAMSDDPELRSLAAERNALLWQKFDHHERYWDRGPWLRSAGVDEPLPR